MVFEPRLDHGVILDGWTLKDRIRKNDLLRWIVEGFIQPIAAFAHYVLGALVVAWGPFAIAALTGQGNDLGAPPLLSKAALAVLVAQQTGTLLFYLIMALDYNLGTVCLLLPSTADVIDCEQAAAAEGEPPRLPTCLSLGPTNASQLRREGRCG